MFYLNHAWVRKFGWVMSTTPVTPVQFDRLYLLMYYSSHTCTWGFDFIYKYCLNHACVYNCDQVIPIT